MTKRRLVLRWGVAALTLALLAVTVLPARSQTDDLDVLKVIPENYKVLLENAFVRVIEARVPPGTVEKPHRHFRGVSVCMTEYTIESRAVPDGEWVRSERKLGTVYWSEASLHQCAECREDAQPHDPDRAEILRRSGLVAFIARTH